jgi:hypothetical protein
MTIALDHFTFVFAAVLEDNSDPRVQLLNENVKRFLARFHLSTLAFKYRHTLPQVISYKSLMKSNIPATRCTSLFEQRIRNSEHEHDRRNPESSQQLPNFRRQSVSEKRS